MTTFAGILYDELEVRDWTIEYLAAEAGIPALELANLMLHPERMTQEHSSRLGFAMGVSSAMFYRLAHPDKLPGLPVAGHQEAQDAPGPREDV